MPRSIRSSHEMPNANVFPIALEAVQPSPRACGAGVAPGVSLDGLEAAERAFIDRLRQAARQARCGRHLTLAEAHRALVCPGAASGSVEALVRTLGEVLGRRPVFHAPGAQMASFDEAWIARCHRAQSTSDVDSLALLVRRRVAAPLRRAFLDVLRAA